MTTVMRLLRHPVTLISRVPTGSDDEWGQPIMDEVETQSVCHWRQIRTGDQDRQSEQVVYEDIEVFLPSDCPLGPYDAIEIEMAGRVERMEVVGQPNPAHNARLDTINHIVLVARRSAP